MKYFKVVKVNNIDGVERYFSLLPQASTSITNIEYVLNVWKDAPVINNGISSQQSRLFVFDDSYVNIPSLLTGYNYRHGYDYRWDRQIKDKNEIGFEKLDYEYLAPRYGLWRSVSMVKLLDESAKIFECEVENPVYGYGIQYSNFQDVYKCWEYFNINNTVNGVGIPIINSIPSVLVTRVKLINEIKLDKYNNMLSPKDFYV